MIDIINGIGRFINDTAKSIMGTPNYPPVIQPQQIIIPNNVPCTTCGQNGIVNQQVPSVSQNNPNNNNNVVFNAEKQNTFASRRTTPELEVNLRNTPYRNTTGMKFN